MFKFNFRLQKYKIPLWTVYFFSSIFYIIVIINILGGLLNTG